MIACALCVLEVSIGRAEGVSFESGEGFTADSDIASHAVWQGTGKISERTAKTGTQALQIPASSAESAAAWNPSAIPQAMGVIFIDFFIRPTADASANPVYTIDAHGVRLAFLATPHGGTAVAVTSSETATTATNIDFAVDSANLATTWLRVTIREDLPAKSWDLFLDGQLVLFNQPLLTNARGTGVTFYSSPAGDAFIDDLSLGIKNPLFGDADQDGIPDAFEIARGSNPGVNDRETRLSSTGLTNLEAFVQSFSDNPATPGDIVGAVGTRYVDQENGNDSFTGRHSYPVGSDGPKQSFASAVTAASSGDVVVFLPSTTAYHVDLAEAVNKSLTLKPTKTVTLK